MTPAERAAAWRAAHPYTRSQELQRSIIEEWVANPNTCPYYFHHNSWTVRSKESHRPQNQVIVKGVRLDPASVKWCLIKGTYLPRNNLDYRPRIRHINQKHCVDSEIQSHLK